MDEEITDEGGRNRLTLQYAEGNFHSLVWHSKTGDVWTGRVVITAQDFQRGCDRRRWIAGIHSIDLVSGRAVIKVAEGNVAFAEGDVTYIYSWREWDLSHNREVRRLRACDAPFEKYETEP
jgi:NADPH-dependent curcumin reductase CurA